MTKQNIFMQFALSLASLSKCTERHVAAVITDKDMQQVYSIGINGGPKKVFDCMCVLDGKFGCLHAEINALIKCTSVDTNKLMFVTLSPCKQCAAAIINSIGGFSTVYYNEVWKDSTGLKILNEGGINTVQLTL